MRPPGGRIPSAWRASCKAGESRWTWTPFLKTLWESGTYTDCNINMLIHLKEQPARCLIYNNSPVRESFHEPESMFAVFILCVRHILRSRQWRGLSRVRKFQLLLCGRRMPTRWQRELTEEILELAYRSLVSDAETRGPTIPGLTPSGLGKGESSGKSFC